MPRIIRMLIWNRGLGARPWRLSSIMRTGAAMWSQCGGLNAGPPLGAPMSWPDVVVQWRGPVPGGTASGCQMQPSWRAPGPSLGSPRLSLRSPLGVPGSPWVSPGHLGCPQVTLGVLGSPLDLPLRWQCGYRFRRRRSPGRRHRKRPTDQALKLSQFGPP